MMLTGLAEVARDAGLKVVEVDGWKTRGHGEMSGAPRTITCHHTANGGASGTHPSLNVVKNGRPGLSGPLAHYLLATDGTVYVVAAGKCYHAGVSLKTDYTNEYAIGIEAEAQGTGAASDWPKVQMDAYHMLCQALVKHYALSYSDVRGHKETCSPKGRKSDPSFNMDTFRAGAKAAKKPEIKKVEDDMQWTDKVKLTTKDAEIWNEWGGVTTHKAGEEHTIGEMLRYPTLAKRTDIEVRALVAAVAALTAKVDALAEERQA